MGFQKGLILLLLLTSCGIKKKTHKQTTLETKSEIVINNIETDSSVSYLNISQLKIIQRDTTQPIVIKDFKGNTTTFYNVREITTVKDRSVIKTNVRVSNTITETVGSTLKIDEQIKTKEPVKVNYWYIILFIAIFLIVRKFIKTYFSWI